MYVMYSEKRQAYWTGEGWTKDKAKALAYSYIAAVHVNDIKQGCKWVKL